MYLVRHLAMVHLFDLSHAIQRPAITSDFHAYSALLSMSDDRKFDFPTGAITYMY